MTQMGCECTRGVTGILALPCPSVQHQCPWASGGLSIIPQLTCEMAEGKKHWQPYCSRACWFPFSIQVTHLLQEFGSVWQTFFMEPVVADPYHSIIHSVPEMGCSIITCMSWLLERLIPRVPLSLLFKICIALALFHSFGTSAVIFASLNAITNSSEV